MVPSRRVPTRALVIALLMLGVAACGGGSPATVAPVATAPASAAAATPPAVATTAPTSAAASSGATAGPASALAASFCTPWTADVIAHWPPFEQLEAEKINALLMAWQKDPALAAVAADMAAVFEYVDFVARGGQYRPAGPEVDAAFARINAFAVANC